MKKYIKPNCEIISIDCTNICVTSTNIGACGCDIESEWHDQGCIGCECGCK